MKLLPFTQNILLRIRILERMGNLKILGEDTPKNLFFLVVGPLRGGGGLNPLNQSKKENVIKE